jgi:hypothetical protein
VRRLTSEVTMWIVSRIVRSNHGRRTHRGISIGTVEWIGSCDDLTGLKARRIVSRVVVLNIVIALLVRISMLAPHR